MHGRMIFDETQTLNTTKQEELSSLLNKTFKNQSIRDSSTQNQTKIFENRSMDKQINEKA